jgi:glycerol-3-phosphate acyltransferase PlsX
MIQIALDAMGGDNAPQSEVHGAVLAAQELQIGITLVGDSKQIKQELKKHPTEGLSIDIIHASQVISMRESVAVALRKKKDSSIRVATHLVREGQVSGIVSAGNTGASLATAKLMLGVLDTVDRPALAALLPTAKERPALLLDVGANVDCKANQLFQFAVMGESFARLILGISHPRVGLLSIGEEEIKGNELTKEVFRLLQNAPLNFIGNIEGRDVFKGEMDVIVCDGFIGNVALKVSEGLSEMVTNLLKKDLSTYLSSQIGALLSRRAFQDFMTRVDYAEYGGAPLLGVKGAVIICHGHSTPKAIKNAIRVAVDFCINRVNERIEKEINIHSS